MQRTNKLIIAFTALTAAEILGFAIVINLLNRF